MGISCCDVPQMGFFTESMGLYSENRYIMSSEEADRSGKFMAKLVKLCMKSLDKMLSDEEHVVAVLPDPVSKTLTIRDNGMGFTERDLLNFLDIRGDFGTSEEDKMMVIHFGGLEHLLHKVILSTKESQYIMEAQQGETLSLRKETDDELLARGTKVVLHLIDDHAKYYLDKRVITTVLNKYLGDGRHAFYVGNTADECADGICSEESEGEDHIYDNRTGPDFEGSTE